MAGRVVFMVPQEKAEPEQYGHGIGQTSAEDLNRLSLVGFGAADESKECVPFSVSCDSRLLNKVSDPIDVQTKARDGG